MAGMSGQGTTMLGVLVIVVAVGAAQQWWSDRKADDLGPAVAALAQTGDIRMISSRTCSSCMVAKAWFVRNQVAYSECTIETDAACRRDFAALGAPGTPLIQVRGRNQLGFNPDGIQAALQPRP